jgi:hypothetical protein
MAQLEPNQPTPAVMSNGDDTATVRLVVHGSQTAEWRTDYNARARSESVPVEAWWIEGQTVLQIAVGYRPEPHPVDIFQALSSAVQLLDGQIHVATPRFVDNQTPARDARQVLEATVDSWWDGYRRAIQRN